MKIRLLVFLVLIVIVTGCRPGNIDSLILPRDPQTVARGSELVKGLAACGVCHGQQSLPQSPLAGGQIVYDAYGELRTPNITPSKTTGIGSWTDEQILGALRGRWGENEKKRSPDIHRGYEWISDKDAMSIVSYLRSVTPIKNEVQRRSVSFMDRNTTGFFEAHYSVAGYVPEVSKKTKVQYGRYLVDHVARCGACHSTPATLLSSIVYLGGGEYRSSRGSKAAPDLIGSEETMSHWSEPEIVDYFKSGKRPDGSYVDTKACPIPFYAAASIDDVTAIALYIRSLS